MESGIPEYGGVVVLVVPGSMIVIYSTFAMNYDQ